MQVNHLLYTEELEDNQACPPSNADSYTVPYLEELLYTSNEQSYSSFHMYAFPSDGADGGGGGGCNAVFSAIMREKPMPTPSMTASRIAHPIALLRIALAPPRTASDPP